MEVFHFHCKKNFDGSKKKEARECKYTWEERAFIP